MKWLVLFGEQVSSEWLNEMTCSFWWTNQLRTNSAMKWNTFMYVWYLLIVICGTKCIGNVLFVLYTCCTWCNCLRNIKKKKLKWYGFVYIFWENECKIYILGELECLQVLLSSYWTVPSHIFNCINSCISSLHCRRKRLALCVVDGYKDRCERN